MKNYKFESLKRALFNWGLDYIEEFLCMEADGYSKDELDELMDNRYEEISEEDLQEFYDKFMIQ